MACTIPKCKGSTIAKTVVRQAHKGRTNVNATNIKTTAVTVGNTADNATVDGDDAAVYNIVILMLSQLIRLAGNLVDNFGLPRKGCWANFTIDDNNDDVVDAFMYQPKADINLLITALNGFDYGMSLTNDTFMSTMSKFSHQI